MSERIPEIGAIYKWIGGKEAEEYLDVAHYLVVTHKNDIYWTCIELETGTISEYSFHSGNWMNWEIT